MTDHESLNIGVLHTAATEVRAFALNAVDANQCQRPTTDTSQSTPLKPSDYKAHDRATESGYSTPHSAVYEAIHLRNNSISCAYAGINNGGVTAMQ